MAKKRGPDIRDVAPTGVHMDLTLTINGGSLSGEAIGKVATSVRNAFERSAHECGIGSGWSIALRCVTPKRFDAMNARHK